MIFTIFFFSFLPFCVSVRPLSVSILSSEHAPLSADRKYEINCMTVGSRPPANLSWYMEGKLLTNYTQKVRLITLFIYQLFINIIIEFIVILINFIFSF